MQKRLIDSSPPKVMQDPKPKVYRRYQGKCSRQKEHCICSKLHMQRWGGKRLQSCGRKREELERPGAQSDDGRQWEQDSGAQTGPMPRRVPEPRH